MKLVLSLVTISLSCAATVVNAQAPTPDAGGFNQFDRAPVQQRGVFSNPNSGSRQFFQQGRENLYFLEESEPILEIEDKKQTETETDIESEIPMEEQIQERQETLEPAE